MAVSLRFTATNALDGTTLVDLSAAQNNAGLQAFEQTVADGGLFDPWTFAPLGARDWFVWTLSVPQGPTVTVTVELVFPTGERQIVPGYTENDGFIVENLVIPQGCQLAIRRSVAGAAIAGTFQLWASGIGDDTYASLTCCHRFSTIPIAFPQDFPFNPLYVYWVDSRYDGSNGPSDGSQGRPFTTIQDGINAGWFDWAILAFENYATVLVAPGDYAETALLFYPFVSVVGLDGNGDSVRITSGAPIDIFSFGYYNLVNLRFETDWDVLMTSVPFFGFTTWVRSWRCRWDDAFVASGLGAGWHFFEMHDAYFSSGVATADILNAAWWGNHSITYGDVLVRSSAAGTVPVTERDGNDYNGALYWYDGYMAGDADSAEISGADGVWVELAGRVFGSSTVDGANSTAAVTTEGYPEGGQSLLNGAAQWGLAPMGVIFGDIAFDGGATQNLGAVLPPNTRVLETRVRVDVAWDVGTVEIGHGGGTGDLMATGVFDATNPGVKTEHNFDDLGGTQLTATLAGAPTQGSARVTFILARTED